MQQFEQISALPTKFYLTSDKRVEFSPQTDNELANAPFKQPCWFFMLLNLYHFYPSLAEYDMPCLSK